MKILQIGAYPPPIGGVAEHVRRLDLRLRQLGIDSTILDLFGNEPLDDRPSNLIRPMGGKLNRLRSLVSQLRDPTYDVVHVHLSNMTSFLPVAPIVFRLSGRRPVVASLHGQPYGSGRRAKQIETTLASFKHIVASNQNQADYLRKIGRPSDSFTVVPAFIPLPTLTQEVRKRLIPQHLSKCFVPGRKTILVTGYAKPLYGHVHVAKAVAGLPDDEYCLIAHTYTNYDDDIVGELSKLSASHPHIVFNRECTADEFQAILQSIDIYIRSTSEEGDSVALREAISHGKQVIATDAAPRPAGCILYRFDDITGLQAAIRSVSCDPSKGKAETIPDGAEKIAEVYQSLV